MLRRNLLISRSRIQTFCALELYCNVNYVFNLLLFKIRFNTTRLYSNALMAEQTQKNWKRAHAGNHQIFMIKKFCDLISWTQA